METAARAAKRRRLRREILAGYGSESSADETTNAVGAIGLEAYAGHAHIVSRCSACSAYAGQTHCTRTAANCG
ncbi:hypothetical protein PORY_002160 [Pneumocystis oryctolagi]|uniref:Uncharacterized protein n=1 Tax=Pneumocystis oryctolagi TaxID=42067 RepID=A0ACB7CBN1_9ASCO|nr:hypothetical protein PORY_002160 [Pneumocystis oryctolagi]